MMRFYTATEAEAKRQELLRLGADPVAIIETVEKDGRYAVIYVGPPGSPCYVATRQRVVGPE